jgi:hypothetical protein
MTIPLILIFGVWAVVLVKLKRATIGTAIVIGLFGVFLGGAAIGPVLREGAAEGLAWIGEGLSRALS